MTLRDDVEKARELLAAAEQVALLLPPHPSLDALAAAEVLARTLAGRGAYVGFLPGNTPDASLLPDALEQIRNPRPLIRERIIAIDTADTPVGQLRYEKHDGQIEIILSPKSGAIREDAFSFRDGKIQCDVLVAVGVPDIEEVPVEALGLTPQFFTEVPIVNIGTGDGQKSYGEANLVAPDGASLSEIAGMAAGALDSRAPSGALATLLLAGLMSASRNFTPPVRADAHRAAADLLERGADQAAAATLAGGGAPFPLLQLIARASVRSKETDGGGTLWSFLTAEDFEKTGRTGRDTDAVMEALPRFFPPHATRVLLWQDPGTREIRSLIAAPRPALAALAERTQGVMSNPAFVPALSFLNFLEAEERIAALLREVR